MHEFDEYLSTIEPQENRDKIYTVLNWISTNYPDLKREIKWNQPMFIDDKTFIIAFSVSKHHFAIAPEAKVITKFAEDIEQAGYSFGSNLFRIKWQQAVDYDLLKKLIDYNIHDKKGLTSFWR